jgi:hypothetical protein
MSIFLDLWGILCELTRMTARPTLAPGHVVAPSLAIGTMSLVLVVGLDLLGLWNPLDAGATAWTERLGEGMRDVPAGMVLLMTALGAYGLPLLMLASPRWWRRAILWMSGLFLTAAWLPVLALASWKLPPCMPVIAVLWSGLCALIYAQRHRLPCEMPPHPAASSEI